MKLWGGWEQYYRRFEQLAESVYGSRCLKNLAASVKALCVSVKQNDCCIRSVLGVLFDGDQCESVKLVTLHRSWSSSSRSLSCDRSIASSKAYFPDTAIKCFLFNFFCFLVSLRSSCIRLRVLLRLRIPSISPSVTCFRRQFQRKVWPV